VSSVAARTGLNANSIAGWLQNWTAFYTANPTATQGLTITQAAYGATIGDAIGTALVNPTPIGPTNMPAGLPNTTFSSLQNQVYNALILNGEGTYVAGVAIGSLPHETPLQGGGGSGNVAFTALHTYYISPTGNDSNNGTSAATPWATPNHSVQCGDVIIAAAGAYNGSNGFSS